MIELDATLSAIRQHDPSDYEGRPLPCPLDGAVNALLWAFIGASSSERDRLGLEVDPALSRVLLAFAERMASMAVRLTSAANVFIGLVALAAEGRKTDPQANLAALSVLHDAALRIGVDPREAFDEALPFTTKVSAGAFDGFLQRPAEDKSLEAGGYRAGADKDGFRYERTP